MSKRQKSGRSMRSGNRPSPYTKHEKKPHRYSEILRRWHSAVVEGKRGLAERLSREHHARFGP